MPTLSEALRIAVENHQLGQLAQAEQIYRQILRVRPEQPDALHLLGLLIYQQGQEPAEAVRYIRKAVQLKPNVAGFQNSLGSAFCGVGQRDEATACYRRAIELEPDLAEAHSNLGSVLVDQGSTEPAIASLRRAIQINPSLADAHLNMGHALSQRGQLVGAIECFERARQLQPQDAKTLFCLGNAQQAANQLIAATDSYRLAIRLDPSHAPAHNNLGNTLRLQGQLDRAVSCYRRALELQPMSADAHNNLGDVLEAQGRLDEAVAEYRRAIDLKPDFVDAHSNWMLAEQYRSGVSLATLGALHREWDSRHAKALAPEAPVWANTREPDRPLKLGFVSADFGRHPVAHFSIRFLEQIDSRQFTTCLYSNRATPDDMTERFRQAGDVWHDVCRTSDTDLDALIRADQIDILFDLAGHTRGNRLLVFARRPAPIQISWIGYGGTTGLTAMDHLLADRFHVPPEDDSYYQERVIRLPQAHVCFDPPADAPAVTRLPALEQGVITYCSFNNPAKITPQVVAAWAEVLERVPRSRLVLKYQGLDESNTQGRYVSLFEQHGVKATRLEFQGKSPHPEMLGEYNRADIALDPFPFCGGMTTCLALWMGVPVVTLPGETFAGRQSLSFLSHLGLTATVAQGLADYVQRAVQLAQDLDALAQLRSQLRSRVSESPLCDGERFAVQLGGELRHLWRSWCQRSTPDE